MNPFTATLDRLRAQNRLRSLNPAKGIDFTSNDYLGLTMHPALRAAAQEALANGLAIGAGGSRLLRGNHPEHERLEAEAAEFFGSPAALFFANGYQANLAVMQSLPQRGDVILFDALVHASLRDGIQASLARHIRIPHNDLAAFESALKEQRAAHKGTLWVVTESVFSMDGDLAPLRELAALCARFDAMLIVDEAHATGVFGQEGKGLCTGLGHERLITIHTCGKALGVAGALVCAEKDIIAALVNTARPFIYSTAPMPLQAYLVRKSLELCAGSDDRRARLAELCALARQHFPSASPSPIMPIVMGGEEEACSAAAQLQDAGFDVRAIRPPTVAPGTSRLRITLNALLEKKDVLALAAALRHVVKEAA